MTPNTAVTQIRRNKRAAARRSTNKARCARRRAAKRPTTIGYVLYENPNIVVIVTLRSKNPKTGPMLQVWILPRDVDPMTAVKLGLDDVVCFDCKHRGNKTATIKSKRTKRTCYVQVGKAPLGIWRAYHRGRYEHLKPEGYGAVFTGQKVRWGAYGEPVLIPVDILQAITAVSDGWTGYTHQWRRPEYQVYRSYVMASVDSPAEYFEAQRMGWRTFRCRTAADVVLPGEIICPATPEGNHKSICSKCRLCDGAHGAADGRKSIVIIVHGAGAKSFVSVDSLIASAAVLPTLPAADVKLSAAARDAYIAARFGAEHVPQVTQ